MVNEKEERKAQFGGNGTNLGMILSFSGGQFNS